MNPFKKRLQAKLMIYVPTRGRVDYQHTIRNLPKSWHPQITIVCPKDEVKKHAKNWPQVGRILAQPDSNMTIAAKRAFIFKTAMKLDHEKILMFDDDLRFSVRKSTFGKYARFGGRGGSDWKRWKQEYPGCHQLVNIGADDPRIDKMLKRVEHMLGIYAHGGISPRLMNQEFAYEFTNNVRAIYALAYHTPTVVEHCKLGRIETREDMDYTLQLLRSGFENAVYTWGCVEQARGYGAEGGVGGDSRIAASNADAEKLAKMHPGLVKVVEKSYKVSIPRKEVIVYWQKAITEGRAKRFL